MNKEIVAFDSAIQALEKANDDLDKVVSPLLKACVTSVDVMELIGELPCKYRGLRRMYEYAIRLEDLNHTEITV